MKIKNARSYVGKAVNVLNENKFVKARLLKVCFGNKDYFTGTSIRKTPPTNSEVCEIYLVEFENGTLDYVNELYDTDKEEDKIKFVNNGRIDVNLSLLNNPTLAFKNTIGTTKESINTPITYKDCCVGWITNVTEEDITCRILDRYICFYPEYHSPDGIEPFKLFGIDVSLPMEEINRQLETDTYVAVEMYKQFMKDNMVECAKVRKQILKKQEVNYFKNQTK